MKYSHEQWFILFSLISIAESFTQLVKSRNCNYCISPDCTGTVFPAEEFNAQRDRVLLEHAILGWGTAEDVLIKILTARSDAQRLEISEDYIKTGRTLTDDIIDDTRGKFFGVLIALTKPLPLFYAQELRRSITYKNTEAMIEIMTSLPGCAIREISVVYRIIYAVSLYDDISSRTWFKFRKLMLELAKGDRDEHEEVSPDQAKKDANILISSGVKGWRAKRTPFIEILTKRSYPQLRATFEIYDNLRRMKDTKYQSLLKDVDDLFSDKIKDTFLAIIKNVLNQPRYFADQLQLALSKFSLSVDSQKVIRIIRGRCELDLGDIKQAYADTYKKSLVSKIKDQTKRDFQKTLVAIVKE